MSIGFQAIVPKLPKNATLTKAKITRELQQWAGRTHKRVATYPTQQPTTYRRTGTLGRRWIHYYGTESGNLVAIVSNNVPYAQWVQDEDRQSRVMKAKGWITVQEAGRHEWKAGTLGPIKDALSKPFD